MVEIGKANLIWPPKLLRVSPAMTLMTMQKYYRTERPFWSVAVRLKLLLIQINQFSFNIMKNDKKKRRRAKNRQTKTILVFDEKDRK